ncbi:MAG: cell division FtsA domain-containing protein [Culicoidibacterales bacterium]
MNFSGRKIYTAIDIGSDSVKIVTSEYMNTKQNILCAYTLPSKGIQNGVISNPTLVTTVIRQLLDKTQKFLGMPIREVIVSIPSVYNRLTTIDNREVYSEETKITGEKIDQLLEKTVKMVRLPNEIAVNFIPFHFAIDGGFRTDNPREYKGKNMSVTGMVVTISKDILFDYLKCIENAGVTILNIYPSFHAGIKSTFLDSDLKRGALYINFGHDTSTIVSVRGGEIRKLKTIKMGAQLLINDLKQIYKIEYEEAYKILNQYASANINKTTKVKLIELHPADRDTSLFVSEYDVSEIIQDRLTEMMKLIENELDYFEVNDQTKIAITGGLTNLINFKEVAEENLQREIQISYPPYIGVRDAMYTVAVGLIELQSYFDKLLMEPVVKAQTFGMEPLHVETQQNEQQFDLQYEDSEQKTKKFFKRVMNVFYDKQDK